MLKTHISYPKSVKIAVYRRKLYESPQSPYYRSRGEVLLNNEYLRGYGNIKIISWYKL